MKKALLLLAISIFSLNIGYAFTNVTGGIFSNTTWTVSGSPYIVTDTVTVVYGVTLTIQPGVTVKFNANGLITGAGNMIANGTPTDSIILTSNAATPVAGIYNGITISSATCSYCRFSYAAAALNNLGSLVPTSHCSFTSNLIGINSTGQNIDTCTFLYDTAGIEGTNGQMIQGCVFRHNSSGFYVGMANFNNCIFNNNRYGINSLSPLYTVANCTFDSNTVAGFGGSDVITNCIFRYNAVGIQTEGSKITLNDISNNVIGIEISDYEHISCNTFCNNKYSLFQNSTFTQSAKGNYFCLNDSALIQATIYDTYQNPSLGFVYFTPFDTVPCAVNLCANTYNQDICIVTTDTALDKNVIIWGRTNSPPHGSFNVYDSTATGWKKIASVADTALSEYIDTASHPNLQAYSYRITTVDSCGESSMSPTNSTIYLQVDKLTGRDSLYWTPYVGFGTPKYYIYRGLALNALTLLDSVSGSTLDYVDHLPPAGSMYLVEAINPAGACVPTHRFFSVANAASLSNGGIPKLPLGVTGVLSANRTVVISPNPNNGKFTIQSSVVSNTLSVEVYNMLGEKIYTGQLTGTKTLIDLSNNASGVYLYRVLTDTGNLISQGKFIKQ